MKTFLLTFCLSITLCIQACGTDTEQKVGTLIFTANGEDFVRNGFVSEDGWQMDFSNVYINVYGPTAYQVVEEQPKGIFHPRHGGHPHENIPEGAAHVALMGDYFLQLKQPIFEVGRVTDAPIGNYNRLAFRVKPASQESVDIVDDYVGYSIVMEGTATKEQKAMNFTLKFTEEMDYYDCGPNGDTGVLAQGAEANAEMTFHFDHIFGDADAGPADTDDTSSVNFSAVGFGPFAELGDEDDDLDLDQETMGEQMNGTLYLKIIDTIRSLGHSGEAHCHL